jgi:hypothetical protein
VTGSGAEHGNEIIGKLPAGAVHTRQIDPLQEADVSNIDFGQHGKPFSLNCLT